MKIISISTPKDLRHFMEQRINFLTVGDKMFLRQVEHDAVSGDKLDLSPSEQRRIDVIVAQDKYAQNHSPRDPNFVAHYFIQGQLRPYHEVHNIITGAEERYSIKGVEGIIVPTQLVMDRVKRGDSLNSTDILRLDKYLSGEGKQGKSFQRSTTLRIQDPEDSNTLRKRIFSLALVLLGNPITNGDVPKELRPEEIALLYNRIPSSPNSRQTLIDRTARLFPGQRDTYNVAIDRMRSYLKQVRDLGYSVVEATPRRWIAVPDNKLRKAA